MDILMPQLGETVAEGKITTWYRAVGDRVAAGDSLFEIETDKTSMDVPTTVPGVLSEIRVAAGVTVPVGAVVAVLAGEHAGGAPAAVAVPASSAPVSASSAAKASFDPLNPVRTPEHNFGPATLPNGIKVTPLARRLAAQSGVNLAQLTGSGAHGHIVAKDVQAAANHSGSARPLPAGPGTAAASTALAAGPTADQVKAIFAAVPFEQIPLDAMRRTVARRLLEAKQTIPHFYLSAHIALDRLVAVRGEFNAQAGTALKLSINDFIIKALALALQRVPESNAAWAQESILRFQRSDVAVAVAVEGGLYTPVIRQAESKSISALSREIKALAERARAHTLRPEDYQGGSITISNLGMYGVSSFCAIVNPPQAAILAVGALERRPFEGPAGAVRFGSFLTATLSCDHRVIDGALGARLLGAFNDLMLSPLLLLA
jgi:pyruvate dehydrogenase E2 component (dihydrolipoamide acetyltransferase)